MPSKIDEQILNAFLDELVGEQQPPDLTERILRKSRTITSIDDSLPVPPSKSGNAKFENAKFENAGGAQGQFKFKGQDSPKQVAPQIQPVPASARKVAKPQPGRNKTLIGILSIAAAVLVAASIAIMIMVSGGNSNPIADSDNAPENNNNANIDDVVDTGNENSLPFDPFETTTEITDDPAPNDGIVNRTPETTPDQNALADFPVLRPGEIVQPPEFIPDRGETTDVASARQMTDRINELLAKHWNDQGLKSANSLLDEAWLLRVSNRLIGETPAADEIQILRNQLADEGRKAIVQTLMNDEKYRGRFLDHWSNLMALKLIGMRADIRIEDDQDLASLRTYLRESLVENKPFDQVAYELVSAVGSLDPERDDFNPATSFWSLVGKRMGSDRAYWTSHISQTFLNQNSRCSQCHSSMDGQMAQKDFFGLHAFFAQTHFIKDQDDTILLVNLDFLPNGIKSLEEAALAFEQDGNSSEAYPAFNQQESQSRSGLVKEFDRRSDLATQIANSDQWKHALVNHVWMLLLNSPLETGHGIDSSVRQLEQELADQVVANDYNIERLIESVVLSEVFDLGIDSDQTRVADNPLLGTPASFSHYYDYPTSFRRATESLAIVEDAYKTPASDLVAMRGVLAQRTSGNAAADSQVLLIKKGLPEKQAAWVQSPGNSEILQRIADSDMTDRQKIEHLIVAALKRSATDEEINQAAAIVDLAESKQQAYEDIWWALFNSFEFTWSDGIR